MQQGTGLPPAPAPPKKRRIWPWVVGVILVIGIINGFSQVNETKAPVEPILSEPSEVELIVDMTLAEDPSLLEDACEAYDELGYDISYAAFRTGYDLPNAKAVFDEFLSRC